MSIRRPKAPRHIGVTIRRLRKQLGWSGAELARLAGTTRQHIQQIETGRNGASYEILVAIGRVLGQRLAYVPGVSRSRGSSNVVG